MYKQLKLATIPLILLILIIYNTVFGLIPYGTELLKNHQKLNELIDANVRINNEYNDVKDLIKTTNFNDNYQELDKLLPVNNTSVSRDEKNIYELANQAGVSVVSLSVNEDIIANQSESIRLRSTLYKLVIQSSFNKLQNFINNFNNADVIYDLDTFTLTELSNDLWELKTNITTFTVSSQGETRAISPSMPNIDKFMLVKANFSKIK